MIYSNSDHCQHQLNGIEAIDYFMAHQVCIELDQINNSLLFHLVLALQTSLRKGHSCLVLKNISNQCLWFERQGFEREEFDIASSESKSSNSETRKKGFCFPQYHEIIDCIKILAIGVDDNALIVWDNESLYLRRYWQFEVEVATALQQRISFTPISSQQQFKAKEIFNQLFTDSSDLTPDWQQVAVANALGRRLSIISGGPGTGKTYTVSRLLATLQGVYNGQLKILMAAPTGKAAQRLKQSITAAREDLKKLSIAPTILNAIPQEAATLHRLLGFRPQSLKLSYDKKHPLRCDVLLIDEVSMIDLPMMARILRAMPEEAMLILLGDADQLPSVETGSILADISCHQHPGYLPGAVKQIQSICHQIVFENEKSHYSHLTLLTQSRRFGGEISAIATEVINAKGEDSWKRLIKNEQKEIGFGCFETDSSETGQLTYLDNSLFDSWLIQACDYYFLKISTAENLTGAFSALAAFRILVPMRIGERGVVQLNQRIEQQLYKKNKHIREATNYKGRPVMVIQNSYSTHLFNGDVGIIWTDDRAKLCAWFEQEEGTYRQISLARLPSIETVYAMTIHKTQGSEFNHVAIVLPPQENDLLSPELLYTGLTRTKEHLYIIANEQVWKSALNKRIRRNSGLRERLEQ